MMDLGVPRMAFGPGDDLATAVARFAHVSPDRVALAADTRRYTWRELDAAMDRVAAALVLDSASGQRVAILSGNCIEYAAVLLGVLRAGMCVVPLPTLASPEALGLMMLDSAPTTLFASAAYRSVAERIAPGPTIRRVGLDFGEGLWQHLEPWCAGGRAERLPPIQAGDPFDIIYSSGTTGAPKGIVHTHASRRASYGGSRAQYFSADAVNVIATPFYSNTTCVTWFLTAAQGGTNVILEKFSADAFLDAVESHRATHAMLVPVQYERLLESSRFSRVNTSSLRYLFSTSAPLRAETKRKILDRTDAELVEIYGLTEGGAVTTLEARKHPDKLASVGKPSRGSDVRIVDETGRELPPGSTGEVVGRSTNMMSGYLNRPDDTLAMVLRLGDGASFFRTGDLGRFDEDGFLYLLDRIKDVIISGGFNVHATDLETVLLRHPDVAEACVIGVPSDRWGETPLGLVVLRPGASATADSLRDWCNERVGKIQRLSAVEVRADLPRNAIGKLLKRELVAPYRAVRQ
jgi:long-chain acyl-CoA synthetase